MGGGAASTAFEAVGCNLCGEDDASHFLSVGGAEIVRCRRCGLVYVSPRIPREDVLAQYDGEYFLNPDGYDDYVRNKEYFVRTFGRRLAEIEKMADVGKVLDVGCAAGFFLELARARGWETAGVEVAESMARYAREELGLDVARGCLADVEGRGERFDVVTMFDVLEHFTDPLGELRIANRLLKESGMLVVTTPNIDALVPRALGRRWEQYKPREHLYYFTNRTLGAMLEKAGFEAARLGTVSRDLSVEYIFKRVFNYAPVLERLIGRVVRAGRIANISLNVNPGFMTMVFARKK